MAQQLINLGTNPNDRTGTKWRAGGQIINENFTELYAGLSNNIVVVNTEADFPVQDASTITLESGNRYYFGAAITTSKSFICENGSAVEGASQLINALIYTGTGITFTCQGGFNIFNFMFSATNGTVFSSTAPDFVIMRNSTCTSCTNVGTFNTAGVFFDSASFTSVSGLGLVIAGASSGVLFTTGAIFGTSASFIGIDLGSSTLSLFRLIDSTLSGPASSIGLKGLANSGNINAGTRALVDTTNLAAGAITSISGIDEQDVRWFFSDVTGTENSRNAADVFLNGGAETITVALAGEWYEIGVPSGGGVTWMSDISDRFTVGTDGVITYIGEVDINIGITGRSTVEKVGGGANVLEVRLAKNWTGLVTDGGLAKSRAQTQSTDPTTVPIGALVAMTTGDNIRAIFSNQSGSSNILAEVSAIEIREA